MTVLNDYSGRAALSICESLLLALNDHKLLPETEVMGVLTDAASTHERAAGLGFEPDEHREVAAVINRIIAGGNSVRRPKPKPTASSTPKELNATDVRDFK